jgi:hypothetical protein
MQSFLFAGKDKRKNQTSDGDKGNQAMVDI